MNYDIIVIGAGAFAAYYYYTKKKKKVAVIGGGIGGMESALVLAKRGHSVTLYEKSDKLGGVFIAAAAPSFKEKDRALIAWDIRELAKYPITVPKISTNNSFSIAKTYS